MLFLVFGVFLGFVLSILLESWWYLLIGAGVAFVLSSIPWEGYQTRCVKEVKLIKLKTRNKCYVKALGERYYAYAYDNREKYNLTNEAYEEVIIKGNVKIYESPKCEEPILKKFISTPKVELLTAFKLFRKTEYVFQIPVGTILDRWAADMLRPSDEDKPK